MHYKIKAGIDIDEVSNFDPGYQNTFDIDSAHIWKHKTYHGRPAVHVLGNKSIADNGMRSYYWIFMDALELETDYRGFFNAL